MANYNTDLNLPMNVGTVQKVIDDRSITRSRSGSPKIRLLQSRGYMEFDVQHLALTFVQKTALDAYYAAWRNQTIQFTWDGVTYNVNWGDPPPVYTPSGPNTYDVTVVFLEV